MNTTKEVQLQLSDEVMQFLDSQMKFININKTATVFQVPGYFYTDATLPKNVVIPTMDNPLQAPNCLHDHLIKSYGWEHLYSKTGHSISENYESYKADWNDTTFMQLTWYPGLQMIRISHKQFEGTKELAVLYFGPVNNEDFFYLLMKNLIPSLKQQ